MREGISAELLNDCRQALIRQREDLLNRSSHQKKEYSLREKGRNEGDLSADWMLENSFLAGIDHARTLLLEIENALARLDEGRFGFCEETEEAIEEERLRAIPWTRLCIEGAEIREALRQRFAR